LEATAWRWLRDLYLRLLVRDPLLRARMSEDERNLLLDEHHADMERDLQISMELAGRGKIEGLEGWREIIHLAEGTDHEMLDEALDFASRERE
jgi:hypothetical protein